MTYNLHIITHQNPRRAARLSWKSASLALGVVILMGRLQPLAGQGTAFTYQGQLQGSGGPATGLYDFKFLLYGSSTGGTAAAGRHWRQRRVLRRHDRLRRRCLRRHSVLAGNWGTQQCLGAFSVLSPRQELTPAPYAMSAEKVSAAGLGGVIASANLAGTYGSVINFTNPADRFAGNGAGNDQLSERRDR